jgi:hypothetical protein
MTPSRSGYVPVVVQQPREPKLFDTVTLRSGEVERITHHLVDGWRPTVGTVASLVQEHSPGVFEAELFDQPGDYAPAALAIVTAEQVRVDSEA